MALDTTLSGVVAEVEAGERNRKRVTGYKKDMVKGYAGPYFAKDGNAGVESSDDPENFRFEYLSYMYPRLAFNNPRVRASSRRLGPQKEVASAMQHGLNRWCVDNDYRKVVVPAVPDYLMCHSVLMTTQEEVDGGLHASYPPEFGNKTPHMPRMTHLETDDFIWDPAARSPMSWRWAGHRFIRDREDLLAEAKEDGSDWNTEIIEELETNRHDELHRRMARGDVPDRNEVELYEVWYPDAYDEDKWGSADEARDEGYNGQIFTIAMGQTGDGASKKLTSGWIRKPRDYYGPRWGPYSYLGTYPVPGESSRLAPILAVESQSRNLNRHARGYRSSAGSFKQLVFVDGDDPKVIQQIKSANDQYVVPVQGFEKNKLAQVAIGGAHPSQREALEFFRDQLNRNAGLSDAQRGETSSTSATEASIASNSSALRMDFIVQQWLDGNVQALRTVAWYLYHDDRVIFPLGEEAADDMAKMGNPVPEGETPFFMGGSHDDESGATFDDLELEIEPYSMERTDQGMMQRRTMELMGLVPNLVQMMAMAPQGVDWADLMALIGDGMNMPGFGDLFHPEEIAAAMGAQAEPSGGEGPMLASTAGGVAGRPRGAESKAGNQSGAMLAAGQRM